MWAGVDSLNVAAAAAIALYALGAEAPGPVLHP
jgi:tRNA G18 (ribose-2'-O)-methylase SpoU